MKARRGFLLVLGTALLAACGVPVQSGAHFTGSWSPERQRTFAWRDEDDRTLGDSRLEGNRFFHARLHEAVEWELSLRGVRYSESAPDLLLHHHLSLADHELETEVLDDSGAPAVETWMYEGASLVVHIQDTRTQEDVWVAWGQANIEPALRTPEAMRRWVYDLVGTMFEDWPVQLRN